MRRVFHIGMVLFLLVLTIAGLGVAGEVYRRYMGGFLALWVFLPVIAVWLATREVRSHLSPQALTTLRQLLVVVACALSVLSFAHFGTVRDWLGHTFVEGYRTWSTEGADDAGRPTEDVHVETAHWYSGLGMWALEWGFILTCVAVPVVVWAATGRAVQQRKQESLSGEGSVE
jgi:hypothetical protein